MLAIFGPWAPNGYLASIPLFGLASIPLFGLFASPPHGDIPSALRPCPLMAIFLRPCGLTPSWRNRYSIRLTANVNFIFPTPPHGECQFNFSYAFSRRNRFSFCLKADVFLLLFRLLVVIFHSRLMTLINFLFGSWQEPISFFLLHSDSCLTAVINVLSASWRDSVSF